MANNNSYAENMSTLTKNASDILSVAKSMNEAIYGNTSEVIVTDDLVLPSLSNIAKRVERAENTISKFTSGNGIIETDDGTHRKIKVDAISRPASNVGVLPKTSVFDIDSNWFFESLQYPRCIVKIDLANKIDADSDRVYVNRIIVPADQDNINDDIKNQLLNSSADYSNIIDFLNEKEISYSEDKDEVKLPLTYEKYKGEFQITSSSLILNTTTNMNEMWYFLSAINYSTVDENGAEQDSDRILSIGDYLRFNNSLFKISDIDITQKRVKLDYNVGYDTLAVYDILELYNDPFSEKIISVGIGIDEIDIVFIKGVNENYNLLSRNWSKPLIFYTNDLKFSENTDISFDRYYSEMVADFGKRMIAQIKEGHLPAYGSKTPNAPTLNKDDFKVVQINTQLEATLDKETYNKTTSDISSLKSNINAIRTTISANKEKLMKTADSDSRITIQNKINSDTEKLNSMTTQFSSLVEELNTLLNKAGAINYTPKYHVRGFFSLPESQYSYDDGTNKSGEQRIIGFETMYRYLHVDESGTKLNTFKFEKSVALNTVKQKVQTSTLKTVQTSPQINVQPLNLQLSTLQASPQLTIADTIKKVSENAVFSDWNLSVSPFLEKAYDEVTDRYVWNDVKADGSQVAINQIDIPIRSGEKVELKVRSISEAGYPYNPLKSEWSNSVIISFPDNLTTNDSVTTILETVKSDMTSVILQETLSSAGLYSHISDSNSKYRHNAENIEYTETVTDASGNTTVVTMSLADKLRSLTPSDVNAVSPSINYNFEKDGSTIKGELKVSTPNMSQESRQNVDSSIQEFLGNTVMPVISEFIGVPNVSTNE